MGRLLIRIVRRFGAVFCLGLANFVAAQPSPDYLLEEMPSRPTPAWVRMVDQGDLTPELSGLRTPAGVRVDIVAEEPVLIDPVGMTFDEDGTPYVLEWREATEQTDVTYEVRFQDGTSATVNRKVKNARDQLKKLIDADNDGIYERSELVMDDLEYPSSVMIYDDWFYFPSVGHVIRRHRAAGGQEFDAEEEILRGMCGYHHHQVSGVSVSHDGWMYTTTGDDDNRAEGSDGSRATVLRTGAIFRSLPDGSQVTEFARGFRNPYRNLVFDKYFNLFHVDNDQEDGSKFQGVRLMHLLEGADYGWRLQMGAKCCRTDFARGAVFGERPGKMPSMMKVGRGAPAGLLIYQQNNFPESFRGLLIYPDCYRRSVRAYRVERDGSSFRIAEQFVLMESADDLFRPVQALAGPDGAIYVLDWRTDSGGAGKSWGDNRHGRLYRLSWSGTETEQPIDLGSRQAWAGLNAENDDDLFTMLEDRDFELRVRAQRELVRRGSRLLFRWQQIVEGVEQPDPSRALALGALAQFPSPKTNQLLAERLSSDPNAEIRRLAAESLGRAATRDTSEIMPIVPMLDAMQHDPHPAVRRAAALAVGRVGGLLPPGDQRVREVVDQLFQQIATTSTADVWLYDGFIRGLERCGAVGVDRLVQASLSSDGQERELAVSIIEAYREPHAVAGLDSILASNTERFTSAQLRRIIETYRQIQVDPPIESRGLHAWVVEHRQAPAELRVAALETLGMIGGQSNKAAEALALRLLNDDDPQVRLSAIRAAGALRMIGTARPLVKALGESPRERDEKLAILLSLGMLQAEDWPYVDRANQGVELVVDELVELLDDQHTRLVSADILALIAQVDLTKAREPAERLLESDDPESVAVAIDVLSSEASAAKEIAQRYLMGQLPAQLKPQVAAALQRHLPQDESAEIAPLLSQLFQGGLNLVLDESEVARIDQLVSQTGNAKRGRELYLDRERTQCAKCHRLEGFGDELGPDLTRVWDTHSVAKVLETIIEPSKEIKEGFAAWSLETQSGQVYSGLKISESSRDVTLRDINHRDIRIPRAQIASLDETRTSLMPVGLVNQLQFDELIDLLAFLRSRDEQRALRDLKVH